MAALLGEGNQGGVSEIHRPIRVLIHQPCAALDSLRRQIFDNQASALNEPAGVRWPSKPPALPSRYIATVNAGHVVTKGRARWSSASRHAVVVGFIGIDDRDERPGVSEGHRRE
ncbi:MAG TPA: hypothetical protein VEH29_12440 [Acidimicrobiales bacterium]|nr:hypothetical protein [Acidimicrobiales bacterium]